MGDAEEVGATLIQPGATDEHAHLQRVLIFVQLGEDEEDDVLGQLGEAMADSGGDGKSRGEVSAKILERRVGVQGDVGIYSACVAAIDSR